MAGPSACAQRHPPLAAGPGSHPTSHRAPSAPIGCAACWALPLLSQAVSQQPLCPLPSQLPLMQLSCEGQHGGGGMRHDQKPSSPAHSFSAMCPSKLQVSHALRAPPPLTSLPTNPGSSRKKPVAWNGCCAATISDELFEVFEIVNFLKFELYCIKLLVVTLQVKVSDT